MDQASIDEHGRFEKFLSEKDLPNPYMVNLRAYKILTDLKAPIRTVKAVIIDNFSAHLFDIGDTVLVNDTTRSTGIQNERLKVISIDRTLDESGRETVSIELSNSKYNSSKAARFESYASNIENYMSTEQNAGDSVVYPFSGDISAAAPGDLMFYLDEGREVVGIELICASSKYRSYGASSITEFANYAPCQLFINGISTAEPMFSTQGSFATSFTLKRLNLMPLYEADAASVITKGFNKFQFKPLTDAGLNVNGLLRLNALVKVTYSS
jgi:hypothetical protein